MASARGEPVPLSIRWRLCWSERVCQKLQGDLPDCRPLRRICQIRHPASDQRGRYQRRSGRFHFSGSCQPDYQRPGLRKANPRKRRFSGRASSLSLRASGRFYQNSESGAGSDYRSGSLPSVCSRRRGHELPPGSKNGRPGAHPPSV